LMLKSSRVLCVSVVLLLVLSCFAVFVSPADAASYNYYMNKSGSNYQILDSNRQVLSASVSSSSSATFNWLLGSGGHAASGSSVYVEAGAYSVDATWNINKASVTVTFQHPGVSAPNVMGNYVGSGTTSSSNGAILTSANAMDDVAMQVYGNYVIIEGLTIDGNAVNQFGGNGDYPVNSHGHGANGIEVAGTYCLVKSSTIHNVLIYATMTTGVGDKYSGFDRCLIYDVGWNGFTPMGAHHSFVTNCELYHCTDVAIDAYSHSNKFTGNYVHDVAFYASWAHFGGESGAWAIGLEGDNVADDTSAGTGYAGDPFIIANNRIENAKCGIIWGSSAQNGNYIYVTGNTLINCDTAHWYAAINLYGGSNCIISDNTLTNCYVGIGIQYNGGSSSRPYIQADSSNNYVWNNHFSGVTRQIVDFGVNTLYTQPPVNIVTPTPTPNPTPVPTNGGGGGGGSTPTPTPHPSITSTPNPSTPVSDGEWVQNPLVLFGFAWGCGVVCV
jgi:hypothetical protein